jgi:hypothetical protein
VARGPHAPSASDHARRRCHAADVVAAAGQRARAPPLHSRHARPTKFGTPRGSPWVERVHGGGGAALSLSLSLVKRRDDGEQVWWTTGRDAALLESPRTLVVFHLGAGS